MKKDAYFFKGFGSFSDIKDAFKSNEIYNKNIQKANELIHYAISLPNKELQVDALKQLLSRQDFLDKLTSNQIMNLYSAFRNLGKFDEMITLYNNVNNETFKQALMAQELLLVAYNKTSQEDKTINLSENLIKNGLTSGDIYGGLGKAYLTKSNNSVDEIDKKAFLERSKDAYEQGFLKFAEFYPGINAVYRYIQLNEEQKAKTLAEIVYLACKKEGAEETSDYWATTTMLEAACIAEKSTKEIENSLENLLKYQVPNWQFESTLSSLKNINKIVNSDIILNVISKLEERIQSPQDIISIHKNNEKKSKQELVTEAILKRSYNYRGLASNFEGASKVGGNFRYGGQLPDHSISRKDIELFDHLLNADFSKLFPQGRLPEQLDNATTFSDIENVDDFMKTADLFIRYHYGTNNFAQTGLFLEDNAEINNSLYDQTVDSVISVSSKKGDKLADSRTNISTIFALGMGDCRHHAQVKQILFDRWQNQKLNKCLINAYECIKNNDSAGYGKNITNFNEILQLELRTIDVRVSLPIEINSIYNAKKTENGKYISATEKAVLEEHTMNLLIKKDLSGIIEKVVIADSFYQNTYPWANFEVDIDKIEVINNEFSFNAGSISEHKSNNGTQLPITLTPAIYAGKRDEHSKDEHGNNLMLLGIPIKISSPQDFIAVLQNRESMEKNLCAIKSHIQKIERQIVINGATHE